MGSRPLLPLSPSAWAVAAAFLLLLVAAGLDNITLASQDYNSVLVLSLILAAAAAILLAFAFWRGRLVPRILSVLLGLAVLWATLDATSRLLVQFGR